jgi:hypothetical protein
MGIESIIVWAPVKISPKNRGRSSSERAAQSIGPKDLKAEWCFAMAIIESLLQSNLESYQKKKEKKKSLADEGGSRGSYCRSGPLKVSTGFASRLARLRDIL